MNNSAWNLAVVGAGPAGLALALLAARQLPAARITVFDARPPERDVSADPRTLALAQGSVLCLQRLGCWPAEAAEPILRVMVSQAAPSPGAPVVSIRAAEVGQAQLGAVLSYGALVARLQAAWEGEVARAPQRLAFRLGQPVAGLKPRADGVEVDAGVAEHFDLAVVAEGGVFAEQARKALARDYGQTAWVGTAEIEGGERGLAVERFTRHGPVALLPLVPLPRPPAPQPAPPPGRQRAALVWCVPREDDAVRELDAAQRLTVLNSLLPEGVGRVVALSPLKDFALGLNAERSLVQGRVVRIGNAAQTLHPVAGQGLNLGLRDVQTLVHALRQGSDLGAALRDVEWARAPDRWGTIAITDFLARSFTWQLPGLAGLRAGGLAALDSLPPLKRALARRMMFGGI